MLSNNHTQQLIDLLNEKVSRLLHETVELTRENRKLKKIIREMEKRTNTENSGKEDND